MWFAWTSGRALRAGEDLRYRRPASSDRRGPFAPGRLFPPTAVLANGALARIAATGRRGAPWTVCCWWHAWRPQAWLSGRLSEFFLVDFVPLLSRADDVVLMAMNMRPFPPNCVEVTRWRRQRFSPVTLVVGSGRARCAGTALWAGAMPPPSPRSKQDHCAEDGVNSVNPTRCWRRRPGSRSIQR